MLYLIGVGDLLEGLSLMAALSATGPSTLGAQALRSWFTVPVAGRQLAAVAAVLGQSGFQRFHSLCQKLQLLIEKPCILL